MAADTPIDDAIAQVAHAIDNEPYDEEPDEALLLSLPDSLHCEDEEETLAVIAFIRLAHEANRQGFKLVRDLTDYNTPPVDAYTLQEAVLQFFGRPR